MCLVGLLILAAVALSCGQAQDAAPVPAKWTILFRADDPAVWDTDAKANGQQIAIPLQFAPATFRYLRLRRMDTWDALILPMTREQMQNGKPPARESSFWWNGTSKEEWKGRHLGIVQGPRHRFPAPKDMIAVMNDGWDGFAGSGFGHKCFVNDGQYFCWRGKEIPCTVFEIGVSDGPLSPQERRSLIADDIVTPPEVRGP